MKSKSISSLLVLFFLSISFVHAEKDPMKFGKVNIEDLKMTEYAADPSAPAVVLCSYGYYDNMNYQFVHLMRVKIFKKEGYDFATRKFPTGDKSSVRGKTFNLVDGKIVAEKLSNKSVFREKIMDNYYMVSVAMPNVKEGSIIDLEIKYTGFPTVWYFQEEIPVVWSELRIEPLDYVSYRKNYFGYVPLTINQSSRWVAKDVPAFKKEPYMDSKENYIAKFEFDITEIAIPGYYYKEYAKTWNGLSQILMESPDFGETLKSGFFLNKVAKQIKAENQSDSDKLKAAVDFVKTIDFNGEDRCFATINNLGSIYADKIGNSADLNIMLTRLLQKLDFEAKPVVLSTKDNGRLSYNFPSIRRLNYVLAYVKVNGKFILVDATDNLLPYNLIPERCLNGKGRMVDPDSSKWVDLETGGKFKELVYYDLRLNEDLSLSGNLSHRRNSYAAHRFRKKMEQFADVDEYAESLTEKYPGLQIENIEIKNLDNIDQPVSDKYEVNITDRVFEMDSTLYLQLALFEKIEENPFKAKKRIYPVDFGVPIERAGIVKVAIPDNFKIVEVPKSVKLALPNNAASFVFNVVQIGNTLTLQYKLRVNKTMFMITEYPDLKAFYNEVIKKESEPLVLKTL